MTDQQTIEHRGVRATARLLRLDNVVSLRGDPMPDRVIEVWGLGRLLGYAVQWGPDTWVARSPAYPHARPAHASEVMADPEAAIREIVDRMLDGHGMTNRAVTLRRPNGGPR